MTDELPWHDLTEAARLTGLDREAIRSKARRGHLVSRKGNSGATLVQIPPDMMTSPDQGVTNPLAISLTAAQAALADVLAELADVRTALARSEAETVAATRVGEIQATALRELADRLTAELATVRAELAQQRRPWWRQMLG